MRSDGGGWSTTTDEIKTAYCIVTNKACTMLTNAKLNNPLVYV